MLLFLVLAVLFPVALYFLILGAINRRDRPLLVSGPWDFAGVLFAASGLLLFVGPEILSTVHEQWQFSMSLGQRDRPGDASYYAWLAVWYLYYVGVVAGAIYMLRRRRSITAVYNVDQAALELGLARVFERLRLPWRRSGNHFLLKPEMGMPALEPAAVLEIETFPVLCNATLRWHTAQEPLRQEIERELVKVLEGAPASDNPAAGWFLWIGTTLLFAVLVIMAYIIFINLRAMHR